MYQIIKAIYIYIIYDIKCVESFITDKAILLFAQWPIIKTNLSECQKQNRNATLLFAQWLAL